MKPFIAKLAAGERLTEAEAETVFGDMLTGTATPCQIAAILMALRVRGETVAELTGAVRALRGSMIAIKAPANAVDVCGTGGDQQNTLNISTAVAFVLAGLRVPVAKHGNRGISSKSGGADVLSALGVGLDLPPAVHEAALAAGGCSFLFAPAHHPALRFAAEARTELGIRTIFNLLGPLLNPASVRLQVVGVFDPAWAIPLAETLQRTGSERAWIVHGEGLDELTVAGDNQVVELHAGQVSRFTVAPEEAGLSRAPVSAIRGGDAAFNARALQALLEGVTGAYRDTVLLNAAAALIVTGRAATLREGTAMAEHSIATGAARSALEKLQQLSRQ